MHLLKIGVVGLFCLFAFTPTTQDVTSLEWQKTIRASQWVDSVMNEMTLPEKVGQMFMIRAHSNKGKAHIDHVKKMISQYHVGGLCFFQGTPEAQLKLTQQYQELSKIPLMISMDAEWGLGMRLKSHTISFPRQMLLGAIQDSREIYYMGKEIARQLKAMGVHVNFAPVIDVNNNPENPVINDRSFGENPVNVAKKGYAYMRGLQDYGVMACAKHFPGHGDTHVDSHKALPTIPHSRARLDSIELFPFRVLIQHQLDAVMVAHLNVPALGTTPGTPTTLSKKVVTDLLKNEMGFEGLIFTDAMEMKALSDGAVPGDIEARAVLAGNDVILLPRILNKAIQRILKYLDEGKISPLQIDRSVRKILMAKYRLGLYQKPKLQTKNIDSTLNTVSAKALKRRLIAKAITLVRDVKTQIPLDNVPNQKVATLSIGMNKISAFQKSLHRFGSVKQYLLSSQSTPASRSKMLKKLQAHELVIVGIHGMSKYASKQFGISSNTRSFIKALNKQSKVILVLFGSPYALKYFDDQETIVMAYSDDVMAQDAAAQCIFGASSMTGKLPVSADEKNVYGQGIDRISVNRLGFSIPEFVGLNSDTLLLIDSLAQDLIKTKAAPGCQVLVAKSGKIVWRKAYGFHTYDSLTRVKISDVYDLASITKIAASTIALMKLYDDKKLDLDSPIKQYFPEMDTLPIGNLVFRDILAHHAGLKPWIAFYKPTMEETPKSLTHSSKYYSTHLSTHFPHKVCNDLFLCSWYPDTIWEQIITAPLLPEKEYRYSDLAFYLAARFVKVQSGLRLDEYVRKNFYKPMGLIRFGFNPMSHAIQLDEIPPTEEDDYFRLERVQGTVHDMGAAMLDGVSGHAGLFGNAEDLAAIMQMLLNNGTYEGKRFLSKHAIQSFIHRYSRSTRRALGFDMKEMDEDKTLNMAAEASPKAFGHLGFTGTAAWADPETEIVYIFLSNRTYPTMENKRLHEENYRPKIQSVIYRALISER